VSLPTCSLASRTVGGRGQAQAPVCARCTWSAPSAPARATAAGVVAAAAEAAARAACALHIGSCWCMAAAAHSRCDSRRRMARRWVGAVLAVLALGCWPACLDGVPQVPCRWKRFPGTFMSDYAKHAGQMHHTVFDSLAKAQADCISIGSGCKGVTCTDEKETECTVRNHEHLRVR
jgi:CelD/BcsL family acetyltransferase involved in cellulose biosynthesis